MYDALTGRYTFSCPVQGEAQLRLSAFRRIERLPGTAHPVVFRVRFACGCGDEHDGLVSHDDLDWAPLGLGAGHFHNLMTSRIDSVSDELGALAATRINAGEWPWIFFCFPEERTRPVFPSSFALFTPGDDALGLGVRCPYCRQLSVNVVSPPHVDLPFHNDREVGVVEHLFGDDDGLDTLRRFSAELWSSRFDARRLELE
ncbi:MAG TPA: hypothetical protein VJ986_02550 [Gaiellaceae bacterium]|nr:hypothetical protein [Gaiellaceae bacterium]